MRHSGKILSQCELWFYYHIRRKVSYIDEKGDKFCSFSNHSSEGKLTQFDGHRAADRTRGRESAAADKARARVTRYLTCIRCLVIMMT